MTKRIGYRVNDHIKNHYDNFIIDKYGHKQNRCGSELGKAMKVYLTLQGNDVYQDDPDVLELMDKVVEKFLHTHLSKVDNDDSLSKDEIKKLKKLLKSDESKMERPSQNRNTSMDMFANFFKETYQNNLKVSRGEIAMLASLKQGISDQRAIQNRINFLIAHEVLEPCAPNIFNIKI